jgi:hypothetical protein
LKNTRSNGVGLLAMASRMVARIEFFCKICSGIEEAWRGSDHAHREEYVGYAFRIPAALPLILRVPPTAAIAPTTRLIIATTEDGCAINSRVVTQSVWPHWRHATGCSAGMHRMSRIRFFHWCSVVAAHWRHA